MQKNQKFTALIALAALWAACAGARPAAAAKEQDGIARVSAKSSVFILSPFTDTRILNSVF